jgi:phenylalanyl-tRNA synthetase alpha chain
MTLPTSPLDAKQVDAVLKTARSALSVIQNAEALEAFRVEYLGKKGKITGFFQALKGAPPEVMRDLGARLNRERATLFKDIQSKKEAFDAARIANVLAAESIDVTLPGRLRPAGSLHPITLVMQRAIDILSRLGFEVVDGPELEEETFNFTRLNIPEHHPARSMQDSFVPDQPGFVLRTHTSPVQVRVMDGQKPPIKIISLGRVFRRDSDPTHTPMFHQLEGLRVDKQVTFSDLKGVIAHFFDAFFGRSVAVRFRPSYFPFTEPSAEVDIMSESGEWLEVMGCGMVHPNVLTGAGLSTDDYQGYAFGFGLDRLAMLYYGLNDLRALFEGDAAFLEQFH